MRNNTSKKRLFIISSFLLALSVANILNVLLSRTSGISLLLGSIASIIFFIFAATGFYLSLFGKQ